MKDYEKLTEILIVRLSKKEEKILQEIADERFAGNKSAAVRWMIENER